MQRSWPGWEAGGLLPHLTKPFLCGKFNQVKLRKGMSMKRMSMVLFGFAALAAAALPTYGQNSMESQVSARLSKAVAISASEAKPNEIAKRKVAYSGIAVSAIKTDNLVQLFNPFAPARYGSALDNALTDPDTGRARAWKVFSIQF